LRPAVSTIRRAMLQVRHWRGTIDAPLKNPLVPSRFHIFLAYAKKPNEELMTILLLLTTSIGYTTYYPRIVQKYESTTFSLILLALLL
jgi:hypothetical protein